MNEKSPLWWFLNRTGPGRFLVQVFGPERDGCPSARKVWLTAWWPLPKEQRREVHAHMRKCPACRTSFRTYRWLLPGLKP